jgi:hypothetical protein
LDDSPVEIELDEVPKRGSARRTVTLTTRPVIAADSFLLEFFDHEGNLNVEFQGADSLLENTPALERNS